MIDVGRCKICHGYYRLVDGRLEKHASLKSGKPCRGRLPMQARPSEYTTGWDHDPREVGGGLPETNRRRF